MYNPSCEGSKDKQKHDSFIDHLWEPMSLLDLLIEHVWRIIVKNHEWPLSRKVKPLSSMDADFLIASEMVTMAASARLYTAAQHEILRPIQFDKIRYRYQEEMTGISCDSLLTLTILPWRYYQVHVWLYELLKVAPADHMKFNKS